MTTIDEPEPDYVLAPATRLLWRTPNSVSLELGGRAVVLDGVTQPLAQRLVRGGTAGDSAAGAAGAAGAASRRAFDELREVGFLWRRDSPDPRVPDIGPPFDGRRAAPTPQLAGELLSLTARHGERAAELLNTRRQAAVVVSGTGRAGSALATLLAAAGVGRVHHTAVGPVRLHHAVPGGVSPGDEGRSLGAAATSAILRAAPDTETSAPPGGERPDLLVLAVDEPLDEHHRRMLHADGIAHLPVSLGLDHGHVGPLVLPGLTSCLRCADLHRRDRDPHWPALAAQLTVAPRHGPASDVAVTASLAAAAAVQILAFLDGDDPATVDGTLELQLPDWRLRRRSRPPHLECDCGGG